MFVLTRITDLIAIPPSQLDLPSFTAIEDAIHSKYADKVIHRVGLVICLYDILGTSDGLISSGTAALTSKAGPGSVNVLVTFRLLVFRPFKGEVVEGTIGHGDEDGMRVHVNFFTDLVIPSGNLFDRTEWDKSEKVHVWNPSLESDSQQGLYFDLGESVRFKIESEIWTDKAAGGPTPSTEVLQRLKATSATVLTPTGNNPIRSTGGTSAGGSTPSTVVVDPDALAEQRRQKRELEGKRSPYGILASMAMTGLGPTVWWQDEAADEQDAQAEEEIGGEAVVVGHDVEMEE